MLVFVFLPLLWVAMRQDLLTTAVGVMVATTIAVFALRVALSTLDLLQMQFVLLTGTLAALYAAAVRRTNEDLVANLVEDGARLSHLVTDARIVVNEFDLDGTARWAGEPQGALDCVVAELLSARWHLVDDVVSTHQPTTFEWDAPCQPGVHRWFVSSASGASSRRRRARWRVCGDDGPHRSRTGKPASQVAGAYGRSHALANGRGLLEALEQRQAAAVGTYLGIGVIVLDDETLGGGLDRRTSDRITLQVANRFVTAADEADEVARIGANIFAFITEEPSDDPVRTEGIARKMLQSLEDNIDLRPGLYAIRATAGVAAGNVAAGELLRRAELAARQGQIGSRTEPVRHEQTIDNEADWRRSISAGLRQAIKNGELEAWFQPVVRLSDGAVIGAEALARWRHPERGILAPIDFISIAEQAGVIRAVDLAMLEFTVAAIHKRQAQGPLPDDHTVSVNMSPLNLNDARIIDDLRQVALRVDLRRIRFEITETTAMTSPEHTAGVLEQLAELGFQFVLDDFGTGYSSMAWIHRLPIAGLKIDQTLVAGLPGSADCRRIVELVAHLANDLGIGVTAEGIETEAQAQCVRKIGCSSGQGFLYGKTVPELAA